MYPDFNRLKVFYYVYSCSGVAAAAQQLNITQPAVSQQIAKLEDELGTKLFIRVNRRIIPTADGESLFRTMKPFMHEIESRMNEFNRSQEEPSGLLRIGMPYEFGKKYMPQVCAEFFRKYPSVNFSLRFGEANALLKLLQTGSIDIAGIDTLMGKGILEWEKHSYALTPVFTEDIILVCTEQYFQQTMLADDSAESLLRQPFITDEADGVSVRNWFRHHYGINMNISSWQLMAKSHSVIVDCLKLGMGLGITSSHFMREEIKNGTMHVFKGPKEAITNYVSLAFLEGKELSPAEKQFMESFKKIISEQAG